jgi:hypothetical protein
MVFLIRTGAQCARILPGVLVPHTTAGGDDSVIRSRHCEFVLFAVNNGTGDR